ncbi:hypothetical protein F2Q69_00042969 [Brassica cretica]|uniref:Uncharacterized protein n=1 Tax=Brassica cretica TaxID=69181 RepID=A0A8S9NJ06_BRACR|nr:hypothetical protein F2Q69_00042969 [Brassica cretica]
MAGRHQPISFRLVAASVSLRMAPDACAATPRAPHATHHLTHVDQHASVACTETPRAWPIHLVLLHVRLNVLLPCTATPRASGDTQLVRWAGYHTDLKGASASRKLANRGRLSPKKKQLKPSRDPIIPVRRSEKFPRIEVYPSAIKSRKPVSTPGSMVSEKPSSTQI